MAQILGLTKNSLTFKKMRAHFSIEKLKEIHYFLKRGLNGESVQCELHFKEYFFLIYLTPVFENGQLIEVVGTATDITNRIKIEHEVQQMAYYDYLTSLPNRRYLQRKVEAMMTNDVVRTDSFAVLFLDMNRFKQINDVLGHVVGDEVLVKVSKQLREKLDETVILSRYGGDEFIVIVPNATPLKAQQIATQIIEEVEQITLGSSDSSMTVGTSIGISMYPQDGTDFETLVGNADSAMYIAKKSALTNFQMFNDDIRDEKVRQTMLTTYLKKALQQDQLALLFAPRVNSKQEIVGFQAYLKLNEYSEEPLPIEQLSDLTEDMRLINEIGKWALKQACIKLKTLESKSTVPIQMNIGIPYGQYNHPLFMEHIATLISKTNVPPESLNFELTHQALSSERNMITLQQLHQLGVNSSLVNFGVEPLSLQMISTLPITHFKISPKLITEMTKENEAVLKSIFVLANGLDVKVVSESMKHEQSNSEVHFQFDEIIQTNNISNLAD